MVRYLSVAVGAAFVLALLVGLFGSVQGVITDPAAPSATEEFHRHPETVAFASNGMTGNFDYRQVQRGFQVYKEVCSACHSLGHVAFRDLTKIGYSEAEVKKIAADWGAKQSVLDPKSGDRADRDNVASDHFPHVYYPGQGNPPDLSLITKAREGGPSYLYHLLTGYTEQPAELLKKFPDAKTPDGLYYNPYFANLNLAMPPPLASDGQVTYTDGTASTVKQNALDVAAFLVWTAEPELPVRHATGFAVLGFLIFGTLLAFGAYRTIWRNVKH